MNSGTVELSLLMRKADPIQRRRTRQGIRPVPYEVQAAVYIVRLRGEPLYVGCTRLLRVRVRAHFWKGGRLHHLLGHKNEVVVEWFEWETREEGRQLERELISKLDPPYNVRNTPDWPNNTRKGHPAHRFNNTYVGIRKGETDG